MLNTHEGHLEKFQPDKLPDQTIAAAMTAAIAAAQQWEGATAPNPPVGCALLDASGSLITVEAHHSAGQLHAEALAIRQARETGEADRIHTVVVTLEPCNHHGRTPPCTDAILSTTARAVVIGVADPNPHVNGGGAARLHAAGLDVNFFAGDTTQLVRLIAPFRKRVLHGLPYVTLKQAINRDGTMLPPKGQKTFTSQSSLLMADALRRRADAIITGSGTVLADDPGFTVRNLADHPGKRRKLLLLDRRRRIPQSYIDAATGRSFDVSRGDDFEVALRDLAASGVLEVLVEAGPQVTAHVLQTGLWDEHVTITQTDGADEIRIHTNGGADVFRHH